MRHYNSSGILQSEKNLLKLRLIHDDLVQKPPIVEIPFSVKFVPKIQNCLFNSENWCLD